MTVPFRYTSYVGTKQAKSFTHIVTCQLTPVLDEKRCTGWDIELAVTALAGEEPVMCTIRIAATSAQNAQRETDEWVRQTLASILGCLPKHIRVEKRMW